MIIYNYNTYIESLITLETLIGYLLNSVSLSYYYK